MSQETQVKTEVVEDRKGAKNAYESVETDIMDCENWGEFWMFMVTLNHGHLDCIRGGGYVGYERCIGLSTALNFETSLLLAELMQDDGEQMPSWYSFRPRLLERIADTLQSTFAKD